MYVNICAEDCQLLSEGCFLGTFLSNQQCEIRDQLHERLSHAWVHKYSSCWTRIMCVRVCIWYACIAIHVISYVHTNLTDECVEMKMCVREREDREGEQTSAISSQRMTSNSRTVQILLSKHEMNFRASGYGNVYVLLIRRQNCVVIRRTSSPNYISLNILVLFLYLS